VQKEQHFGFQRTYYLSYGALGLDWEVEEPVIGASVILRYKGTYTSLY
jgi:hypothetical protein